jgi:hypothetical protein
VNTTANVGVDAGGTLTFGGHVLDNSATGGLLNKVGPGQLNVGAIRLPGGGVNVQAGTVAISANGADAGASKVGTIGIAAGTALDLVDNDLVVVTTSTAAVTNLILAGRNGGAWTGSGGITSAAARANAATGLGVLTGAELNSFGGGSGTFSGQTYAPSDTLVKYTWNGDANFNGVINFDDYVRIDSGFNLNRTGWANGDFNYSGQVNFDDYVLIDVAFNLQTGTLGRAIEFVAGSLSASDREAAGVRTVIAHLERFGDAYAASFLAAVPEPTAAVALLGVPALAGVSRMPRRRRQRARLSGFFTQR